MIRKVSMILVGGVFGFHLKPDMQVHLALFLIALMIVAHLVARPFDELTKDHRVLQWLELGSLSVCWLTLHAGTVFFIGEKEGRVCNARHFGNGREMRDALESHDVCACIGHA